MLVVPACLDAYLQDEQRAERRAAKDASAALSVVDKSTFASRQQALFTDAIKAGFREVVRADAQVGVHRCTLLVGCSWYSMQHSQ
jgi:hypothetical protein